VQLWPEHKTKEKEMIQVGVDDELEFDLTLRLKILKNY